MTSPDPAWERLARLLFQRRAQMSPRYANRSRFASERGVDYRLVYDVEKERRRNFGDAAISALESAYDLVPGTIRRVLDGGELEAADEPRRPGHLTLVPGDDVAAERRQLADQWAAMVTAPVGAELKELKAAIDAAPPGASGADIFPDEPALAEIWAMRETPPQYRLLYAAVWLFTRRNPEQANKAG